jgi:hypothetical protein
VSQVEKQWSEEKEVGVVAGIRERAVSAGDVIVMIDKFENSVSGWKYRDEVFGLIDFKAVSHRGKDTA